MKLNMGPIDRSIRVAIAVIIALLYFTGQITGVVAVILGIVALVFLVTSVIGWCPGYVPFRVSTRKGE
jgi:Na+(H+)/acetate symporter ActP